MDGKFPPRLGGKKTKGSNEHAKPRTTALELFNPIFSMDWRKQSAKGVVVLHHGINIEHLLKD